MRSALAGESRMGNDRDHRKCAEECVAMAQASDDANDKALWITLAQSWLQLGEHVERFAKTRHIAIDADEALAT